MVGRHRRVETHGRGNPLDLGKHSGLFKSIADAANWFKSR